MISSSPAQERAHISWPQLYLGVGLTTLATLLMELSLTRVFSVVFYYHFAFLSISIALFGLGVGGVLSYVVADWRGTLFAKLGALSLVNSVVVVATLSFTLRQNGLSSFWVLAAIYFASALPFLFAGAIVSLAIGESIERVDRVYFFDLLGAAGGCLLLIPLLNLVGGPNTVIAAAILFAVASGIWFNVAGSASWRAAAVLTALGLVGLVAFNARIPVIDIVYAKGAKIGKELFVKWNSFSRIAVTGTPGNLLIVIDADASTGINPFDFDHLSDADRKMLVSQGPGLPYTLRPGAKTMIIGPGGGYDVARAMASGAKDITGVEINPIIANTVMRDRFKDASHNLYFRPEVKIHIEDGRSFIRRSTEKYQVLQATLVDTWASTAAGAFALSENNLYTTDAFYDYLTHLTDDGVLAFTRWGFDPPRESLRLLTLASDALARLGETNLPAHVMVLRADQKKIEAWGAQDTVLISRKPFPAADVEKMRETAKLAGMEAVYLPGDGKQNAFGQYLLAADKNQFLSEYPFDVSAVNDDRPFFFYTVQPRDIWEFLWQKKQDAADYKINRALPMLFGSMGISIVATILVLVLPRLLLGTRLPKEQGIVSFLWYFLAIGVGYILIQVALIQKFVLFLGHPTYALTVIIFAMLVASGCGSFFSKQILRDDTRWNFALVGITILVTILGFIATPLTGALVGLPLYVKVLLTMLLIAPSAFLMGMPFPKGLARLELLHSPSVRWAWSLNAAASVLGSASAIFLAIYLGLRTTLLLGGACYLLALLALVA
ncbi:MAG: hypothetical protein ABI823_20595, partial [Bryobacteraceae bacterium]